MSNIFSVAPVIVIAMIDYALAKLFDYIIQVMNSLLIGDN